MAFILNNTAKNLSVLVVGQFSQAQFSLGPNSFGEVTLTPGIKALLSFSSQGLFSLRPIQATAPGQVFLINPSTAGGPVVRVAAAPEPDMVNLANFQNGGGGAVEETDLIEPLNPQNF